MIIKINHPDYIEFIEVEQLIITENGASYLTSRDRYEVEKGSTVSIITSGKPYVIKTLK